MKNLLRIIAIMLALILVQDVSCAEGFDPEQYTYEELLQIRQMIDERITAMERQYAIDNADREISFQEPEYIVYVGKNMTLTPEVTILSEEAPTRTNFVWSSSDPEIVSVTQRGAITALAPGDAVITAAASDNQYLDGTVIIHSAVPVGTISIWGPEAPLTLGGDPEDATAMLGYSIEPEDAYCQDVIWESSSDAIVTVDEEGQIEGHLPGTAYIYATSAENPPFTKNPVQAVYRVTVVQKVTGIELAETNMTMTVGKQAKLTPVILPENANDRSITYNSTDPEVAAVDSYGNVTATGCGECDIVCTANGGDGISVSCHITAIKLISGIAVSEPSIILPLGSLYTVETVITPEDATRKDVIWTSSNVYVARAAAGKIEAVGQGDCIITCTTMDGSNLQASVNVHVPSFSVEATEYTVTAKDGMVIPFHPAADGYNILYSSDAECFTVTEEGKNQLRMTPVYAGSGTLTLVNEANPEDTYVIQITVDNNAVYNDISYPMTSYKDIMINPDEYEDTQISIQGKMMQITEPEKGHFTCYLGTGGKNYTDDVIRIQGEKNIIPEEMPEDAIITIFGTVRLERSYSDLLETEIADPVIEVEKIVP